MNVLVSVLKILLKIVMFFVKTATGLRKEYTEVLAKVKADTTTHKRHCEELREELVPTKELLKEAEGNFAHLNQRIQEELKSEESANQASIERRNRHNRKISAR